MTPESLTRALENAVERWAMARELRERERGRRSAEAEQARMLDALRESEHRLLLALEASRMGMWDWDIDAGGVTWSPACYAIHGLEPDDFDGSAAAFNALVHPLDRDRVWAAVRGAAERRETYDAEFRIVRPDGEIRWVTNTGRCLYDAGGRPTRMVGTIADITDRIRATDMLREREQQFRATFENAAVGIAHVAPNGRWLRVNERLCRITGYTREEMLGRTCAEITPPDDIPADMDHIRRLLAGEAASCALEKRYIRKDGSPVPVALTVTLLRAPSGEPDYFIAVIEDISARRRVEEALAQHERDLQSLADNSPDVLVRFDRALRHAFVNAAVERATGLPPEAYLGRTNREVGMPADLCDLWDAAVSRVFETGEPGAIEFTSPGLVDAERWYSARLVPERDDRGEVRHVLAVTHDVTDRRRAEQHQERLLDAERAARAEIERAARAKDEFLATLSHELRTPLSAILGWVQILQRTGLRADLVQRGIEVIARNAQAQATLISDLLDVNRIISGKMKLEVGLLDLDMVASAAADTVRSAAEIKGVRLDLSLDGRLPAVRGDAARLQQVFWNLLSNAVKFTPAGGSILLITSAPGDRVCVGVQDTGQGIDPAFVPHLFDRFSQADSSAARKYGGLGLGLSIVKQLVELHGGAVTAESLGRGRGACFTVCLPAAPRVPEPPPAPRAGGPERADEAPAASAPDTGLDAALRGISVLVVDDQPDVLELATRWLTESGATVVTAASGHEALAMLRAERPDVLVSDIGMPDMDGYDFLRRVRAELGIDGTTLPAVAITAFSRPQDRDQALAAGYEAHLTKPIHAHALISVLADLRAVRVGRG